MNLMNTKYIKAAFLALLPTLAIDAGAGPLTAGQTLKRARGEVMAAGDDRMAPVLAEVPAGEFHTDSLAPAARAWLDMYVAEYNSLSAGDAGRAAADYANLGSLYGEWEPIAPVVSAKWNQDTPYNQLCPGQNGRKCMTGCVPTAMAQLIYTNISELKAIDAVVPADAYPLYSGQECVLQVLLVNNGKLDLMGYARVGLIRSGSADESFLCSAAISDLNVAAGLNSLIGAKMCLADASGKALAAGTYRIGLVDAYGNTIIRNEVYAEVIESTGSQWSYSGTPRVENYLNMPSQLVRGYKWPHMPYMLIAGQHNLRLYVTFYNPTTGYEVYNYTARFGKFNGYNGIMSINDITIIAVR